MFFLADLEPGPGRTSSVDECFVVGMALQSYGVEFVVFLSSTEDCQLYNNLEQNCPTVGGPSTVPEEC